MIIYILLFLLLVASAFFSSTETALAILNKAKIKALFLSKKLKVLKDWLLRPASVFSTILIGNNLVNIAFSSILSFVVITRLAEKGFSTQGASIVALVITSFLILLFGEVIPKNIATTYSSKVIKLNGGILNFISFVLSPVSQIFTFLSEKITGQTSSNGVIIDRGDLKETAEDLDMKVGIFKSIPKVLSLSGKKISRVMTPRQEITGIDLNWKEDRIVNVMVSTGYSRFPAYYTDIDNVSGIIYTRDVVKTLILKGSVNFKELLRRAFFVEEDDSALSVYQKMLSKRIHIAIVLNKKGRVCGLITLEDLLEEIFEEIYDEYDFEEEKVE